MAGTAADPRQAAPARFGSPTPSRAAAGPKDRWQVSNSRSRTRKKAGTSSRKRGDADHPSRLAAAKTEMEGLIDELLVKIYEDPPESWAATLQAPSIRAAVLAGALGFRIFPVELAVIRRPDVHPLLDAHPDYETVVQLRVHDPTGLGFCMVDLAATRALQGGERPPGPTPLPVPTPVVLKNIEKCLRSWARAVDRLDVGGIEPAADALPARPLSEHALSLQECFFTWSLEHELRGRGDRNGVSDDRKPIDTKRLDDIARRSGRSIQEYARSHVTVAAVGAPNSDSRVGLLALDDEDRIILDTLYKKRPQLCTILDIDGVSNKTAGQRLNRLIELRYAVRPKGKRSGATLTPAGVQLIESGYRPE